MDTGYLVALYDRADHLYSRAIGWSEAVDEPILVSDFVLLELVNYFSRPMDRARAYDAIDGLSSDPGVTIVSASRDLFEAGYAIHRARPDKSWALTDCISVYLMDRRGIHPALTHDQHFEQAGFEALLRRDP